MDQDLLSKRILLEVMLDSNDPNIVELRNQVLLATKMIHSEEIEYKMDLEFAKERLEKAKKEYELFIRDKNNGS